MSNRISYHDQDDSLTVTIGYKPRINAAIGLPIWVLFWTLFIGYFVALELARTGITGFTVFWALVEIAVLVCFLWNFMGREKVTVDKNYLTLKSEVWGIGVTDRYPLAKISLLMPVSRISWLAPNLTILGPSLANNDIRFEYGRGTVSFAPRLGFDDAYKITETINARIKQYQRKTTGES